MSEISFRIPDDVVEAIAARAAELVLERGGSGSAPSPYMTVDEAAEFLRCRPQRIYDLRSSGRLRRVSDGGRALVLRSELELLVVDEDELPARRRPLRLA